MVCPVPPLDPQWRDSASQPSPEHFVWGEEKVGIPKQLMHQLLRYDHTYPTGSYAGKIFIQGSRLVWIAPKPEHPDQLFYHYKNFEEIGEYDPHPHLEDCPLCHGEAYCGFEAKNSGDLVKFHITCAECGLTYGNEFKIGLERSIANSVLVLGLWNNRKRQIAGKPQRLANDLHDMLQVIVQHADQPAMDDALFRKFARANALYAIDNHPKEGRPSNDLLWEAWKSALNSSGMENEVAEAMYSRINFEAWRMNLPADPLDADRATLAEAFTEGLEDDLLRNAYNHEFISSLKRLAGMEVPRD